MANTSYKLTLKQLKELKAYFKKQPSVAMAYLFGSYAKGRAMHESDVDIAVYFKPKGKRLEWEEEKEYPQLDKIWFDVEKIVKRNVDLAVLNRVPSTLAFEVLRTGKEIIIKDKLLYWSFFSRVSFEAMDFMEFVKDYWAIYQRSNSLSDTDQLRLSKVIEFLISELQDYSMFASLDWENYNMDRNKRRNIERWVENIANSSIDIAKILLASEKKRIPDNYQDTMRLLAILPKFKKETAIQLAEFVKLRNLLAHQYLDFRFNEIKKFIKEAKPLYKYLADYANKKIKK